MGRDKAKDHRWLYAPEQVIGRRWRIVRTCGQGGMSHVYEAEDQQLRRPVALKIAHPRYAGDGRSLSAIWELMKIEARIGAQIQDGRAGHAGIEHFVQVYSAERTDDVHQLPYMAMEFLDGYTLEARIAMARQAKESFPVAYGLQIALDLVKALSLLSGAGLVHCDIKPANLFLHRRRGVPILTVTDLGLVFLQGDEAPNTFRGTYSTAAPEQHRGEAPIAATDLYSAGLVIYEVLTLHHPWEDGGAPLSESAWREAHLVRAVPPLRRYRPDLPKDLDDMVTRMLSKAPANRPTHLVCLEAFEAMLGREARVPHLADPALVTKPPASNPRRFVVDTKNTHGNTQPTVQGATGHPLTHRSPTAGASAQRATMPIPLHAALSPTPDMRHGLPRVTLKVLPLPEAHVSSGTLATMPQPLPGDAPESVPAPSPELTAREISALLKRRTTLRDIIAKQGPGDPTIQSLATDGEPTHVDPVPARNFATVEILSPPASMPEFRSDVEALSPVAVAPKTSSSSPSIGPVYSRNERDDPARATDKPEGKGPPREGPAPPLDGAAALSPSTASDDPSVHHGREQVTSIARAVAAPLYPELLFLPPPESDTVWIESPFLNQEQPAAMVTAERSLPPAPSAANGNARTATPSSLSPLVASPVASSSPHRLPEISESGQHSRSRWRPSGPVIATAAAAVLIGFVGTTGVARILAPPEPPKLAGVAAAARNAGRAAPPATTFMPSDGRCDLLDGGHLPSDQTAPQTSLCAHLPH